MAKKELKMSYKTRLNEHAGVYKVLILTESPGGIQIKQLLLLSNIIACKSVPCLLRSGELRPF